MSVLKIKKEDLKVSIKEIPTGHIFKSSTAYIEYYLRTPTGGVSLDRDYTVWTEEQFGEQKIWIDLGRFTIEDN